MVPASTIPSELKPIAAKVRAGQRITDEECLLLFEKGSLGFVGSLANEVKEKLHGDKVFFNRNFHIEPTNVCVFSCNFCSYSRLYAKREDGWELSIDQMLDMVKKYDGKPVTEVHIVGGVHPKMDLAFFADLLKEREADRQTLSADHAPELDQQPPERPRLFALGAGAVAGMRLAAGAALGDLAAVAIKTLTTALINHAGGAAEEWRRRRCDDGRGDR